MDQAAIVSYRQLRLSQLLPVQSILLYRLQKHKSGKAPAKTQFLLSSRTRSRSLLVVWEDTYKSMEILNPAQLFWVSRLPWKKLHNAFRKLRPHLQTSMLRDSMLQTVNDLLNHVRWCCKPTCTPYELLYLSRRHKTLTDKFLPSGRVSCTVTLPRSSFFLPLKLGGFGVGSAVQRHAAAPWRAWQSVIPSLMTITHSPDTDSLFRSTPILRAQLTQLQSTISKQMNKPTFTHKPLGAALRLQTTQKKKSLHHPKERPQNNSTTASLTHPLNKPSSFHNPLHTLVHTSCSREAKHMRLRIVAFVFQLPED